MKKKRILLVDDVPDFLRETARVLRPHFDVALCSSPLRAVRLLKEGRQDLLVTTLVMKELDGLEVIKRIRGRGLTLPIVMVTGFGTETTSIEALRLGADDYLNKPVEPEELIARIRKLLPDKSSREFEEKPAAFGTLVTRSPVLLETIRLARKAAATESRILIQGETGTGKELFAALIHRRSKRRDRPFVVVNCAAIPGELLESEFFGHEKGAFTGAGARRLGRFEEADAGTLFLDEIGELSFALQSKLLRTLQTGEFSRVGGGRTLHSSARVIAATNRDLHQEVRAGRFRADLFYRLNVVPLTVPPLRERPEDIAVLIAHFSEQHRGEGHGAIAFLPSALQRLRTYDWPGNVRELEHLIERFSVLFPGETIGPDRLSLPVRESAEAGRPASDRTRTFARALEEFQKTYFSGLLAVHHGNLARAAREAGLDRSQFFRKIVALGLHQPRVETGMVHKR